MADVFISYVHEDAQLATSLADGLRSGGYSAWCYERDSLPGVPYVTQVLKAIGEAQAVVLILSKGALASAQVDKEVVKAHETGKHFVPLLVGMTHQEFKGRKEEWAMMLGNSATVELPASGLRSILPRITDGLGAMGVAPSTSAQTAADAAPSERYPWPEPELAAAKPRKPRVSSRVPWCAPVSVGAGLLLVLGAGTVAMRAQRQAAAGAPASASPSPAGKLLWSDDFSDPKKRQFRDNQTGTSSHTFQNGQTATYRWDYAYKDGALVAHVRDYPPNDDRYSPGVYINASDLLEGDFALELAARTTKSAAQAQYQLRFVPTGDKPVDFIVTPSTGGYVLYAETVSKSLVSGRSTAITADGTNVLRLELRGNTARLLANGHVLDRAENALLDKRPGKAQISGNLLSAPSEGELEVRFTAMKAYSLD